MFMLLVNANEALGYTHEQTLDCSYSFIQAMLSEYSYMWNERNRESTVDDDGQEFEWVELPDFDNPGQQKKYKKYKNVDGKIKA